MDKFWKVNFETYPIRFTPKGKVCVIDVIKLLCKTNRPFSLWKRLITDHPEILADCEDYPFQPGENLPVVQEKWMETGLGIFTLLPSKSGRSVILGDENFYIERL